MGNTDRSFTRSAASMTALVKERPGAGHVVLRTDWPRPLPLPDEVLVAVSGCGVCGTDLHIVEDRHKNWPPVVLGHEYTGRIIQVGDSVSGWAEGQRVVCEQHTLACGHCYQCRSGAIHLCPDKRSPGWGIDGGFAEFIALPARLLHQVPCPVSDTAAAMTEPTAICLTGLDRVQPRPGEHALVIGPGPLGCLTALLLQASGVDVVLAGRWTSQVRLGIAAGMGVPTTLASEGALQAEVAERTAGRGMDLAVDTTGARQALTQALLSLRPAGRILELGLPPSPGSLDAELAMSRSATVAFSLSSEYTAWDRALALMASGRFDPAPLAHRYRLGQWQKAFADMAAKRVIKAVIEPPAWSGHAYERAAASEETHRE